MRSVPFTVTADLELGTRAASYVVSSDADVEIIEGQVPQTLGTQRAPGAAFEIDKDRMLLNIPEGASFLVENGKQITYQRNGKSDREVALFLLGSAWGALCYQRDLLPLHASAVIEKGQVHAFTGQSGVGKSTLAATLAKRGRGFFTDDVLIIDPKEIGHTTYCYSGQKDLKLWEDALELTGVAQLGPVRDIENFAKFYAQPDNAEHAARGRLSSLFILKNIGVRLEDTPVSITPVQGALALKELRASVYRPRFATAIWGLPKYYQILANLISSVTVLSFDRSMDKKIFDQSVGVMDQWIEDHSAGQAEHESA